MFRTAGCPCPLYTNPADHLLDAITPPKGGSGKEGEPAPTLEEQMAIDQAIIAAQPPIDVDLDMGADKRLELMDSPQLNPPWHKQVRILMRRNLREQSRKLNILFTSVLQTVIMGVLIGTVFLKIGNTQRSIVRREPMIFFCAINQGVFGALTVINSFPVERTLTLRERASGTYYVSAYFIAKILSDLLVQLPIPILFVSITVELSFKNWIFEFILELCRLFPNGFASGCWEIFCFYGYY